MCLNHYALCNHGGHATHVPCQSPHNVEKSTNIKLKQPSFAIIICSFKNLNHHQDTRRNMEIYARAQSPLSRTPTMPRLPPSSCGIQLQYHCLPKILTSSLTQKSMMDMACFPSCLAFQNGFSRRNLWRGWNPTRAEKILYLKFEEIATLRERGNLNPLKRVHYILNPQSTKACALHSRTCHTTTSGLVHPWVRNQSVPPFSNSFQIKSRNTIVPDPHHNLPSFVLSGGCASIIILTSNPWFNRCKK